MDGQGGQRQEHTVETASGTSGRDRKDAEIKQCKQAFVTLRLYVSASSALFPERKSCQQAF
jgi:hypothetical protein